MRVELVELVVAQRRVLDVTEFVFDEVGYVFAPYRARRFIDRIARPYLFNALFKGCLDLGRLTVYLNVLGCDLLAEYVDLRRHLSLQAAPARNICHPVLQNKT